MFPPESNKEVLPQSIPNWPAADIFILPDDVVILNEGVDAPIEPLA